VHDFTVLAAPYTSPETKQAKNKGGGQMRERERQRDKEMSSYDNDLETAENE